MMSMEEVDRAGQEEFIWAMRNRIVDADEPRWRERRPTSIIQDLEETRSTSFDPAEEKAENTTKIIASLLPDELITSPDNYNDRSYDAAVARGQITGLQSLWNKYRVIGKGGPFRMAQVLNYYLGNVMQESFLYNGDIVECNGVTFTISWKEGNQTMAECVHQAVDCALSIVKNFANFETDVDVNVGVTIGISCGPITFCVIGSRKRATYVVTGDPLEDAKEMIAKISENKVLVDQEAWGHLNGIEYITKSPDNEYDFYVITDFSSAWRSIHVDHEKTIGENADNYQRYNTGLSSSGESINGRKQIHDLYNVRPTIAHALCLDLLPVLKSYVFPPLITAVEAGEPLDKLIEMRYLVIMQASFAFEAQSYLEMVKLTDAFYKMVNNIIEPANGFIMRTTYIANVLIFYVMFGVYGDKITCHGRQALECAIKCFRGSENNLSINSLAMAITSGWVFCGPVGHQMRREYVMIGSSFNRGRQLIEDYPNKVTCDMETFLRSKVDPKHFILQENTKGTSKELGCIYEYVEFDISNRTPKLALNKYPLVDRAYEVETFKNMLNVIRNIYKTPQLQRYRVKYEPSGLFFIGEARCGKTRLIEECLNNTTTDFPLFRLRLNTLDRNIPYQFIYYLFGYPLGIADNSTTIDREAKILTKLKNLPLDGLECLLNVIFRVNFPKIPLVNTLKKAEEQRIVKNIIRCLCRICFNKTWVIFVDNAENIDSESWDMIYPILETHTVLLVVAISGTLESLRASARDVLSSTKCKTVQLLPIDRLYHTTLACQFLECSAIPMQLEKIIQEKSNGNAGWIDNFLTVLFQFNIICLKKIDNFANYKANLIIPIREFMSRDFKAQDENVSFHPHSSTLYQAVLLSKQKWDVFQTVAYSDVSLDHEKISELVNQQVSSQPSKTSKGGASIASNKPSLIGPRHRRSSSHESLSRSRPKVQASKSSFETIKDRQMVTVCMMTPEGNELLETLDLENIQQISMSQLLEELSSFEVQCLKAATVIGDFFLRDMLMFVVSCHEDVKMAEACKHLFELRVIACAEGDFRKPLMSYAPITSDRYKSFDDTIVSCSCVGFQVTEACQQFPRYANCGYMRFLQHDVQQAIYNLLTDAQLYDLHTKSMNFLERGTRKCISCGNGNFTKILGNRYEEGVLVEPKRRVTTKGETETKESSSILENWDLMANNSHLSRSSGFKRFERTRLSRGEVGFMFQTYTKAGVTGDRAKIPPPFEDSDFTCCECDKILTCLYYHIRRHYEAIGKFDKWLHATLEYAALCTKDSNVALALKCLHQALEIIKGPYKETANPGESWKYNVMKAQVLAEMGRARFMIGQYRHAYMAYEDALHYFGYKLPKPSSLRYKVMEFWEYLRITTKSRRGIGCKFGYVAAFCDSVSNCLYMMTKLFIGLEMWDNAYIAALWSLKKALQSEKNFLTMINAFTNLINVCTRKRKYGIVDSLEVMALDYCRRYKCNVDVNDMKSVARLYSAIFHTRVQRARFDEAFSIGICVDPMTDTLNLRSLLIKLFPLFFEMLLVRADLNDMLNALTTFEQIIGPAGDYTGDVWFYALAVYFHLHTGWTLIDIKVCEEYYYTQNKRLVNLKEPEAERRYFVGIWLWYLRTENYAVADMWAKKLPDVWAVDQHESVSNLITTLMYIEGLIILVTYNMDRKMLTAIGDMYNKISGLIRKMEEQSERVKLIAPRLYHLKAYFYLCRMEDYRGWETLEKAIKMAQNTRNAFDEGWAQHSERAWKQDMPDIERTFWKDHSQADVMDYREAESENYKITYYTLEMPRYL